MSAVQIETSRSANRLCLDCTSLARAALSCLALNLLKTNYKTITEIASLKMTMPPVVEGAREQGRPSALVLCLSVCLWQRCTSFFLSHIAVISISSRRGD